MSTSNGTMTDRTMRDWARASEGMGYTASAALYAVTEAVGASKGASSEQIAAAVPYVFLAVSRNGIDAHAAAQRCVQSVMRSDWARAAGHDEISMDAVTGPTRDALNVAILAAGLGHDDVARSRGSLSRGTLLPLVDALRDVATHAPESALMVAGIVADGLGKRVARDYAGVRYAPLKASIVATLKGKSRPRTAVAARAILASACRDYALVEATREGSADDVARRAVLASEALAYVTRDRTRPATPAGQAGWEYVPDQSGEVSRAFQRELGKRANTGGKGRSGPVCGQPMAGLPFESGQSYMPTDRRTNGADDLDQASARDSARRTNGVADAIDVAGRVYDAREHGAPCQNYATDRYVSRRWLADGTTAHTCSCGKLSGTPLVWTSVRVGAVGTGGKRQALTHGLTVCPAPGTGEIVRCECGGKRGILTSRGEHKRR